MYYEEKIYKVLNEAKLKNDNDLTRLKDGARIDFGKFGVATVLSANSTRVSLVYISGPMKSKQAKFYTRKGQKDMRRRRGMSFADTPAFPFDKVKSVNESILRNMLK
tara:strand:- start:263 stop:583 length:321 start_codon:yes stop_codon:yes gene_type:complete